MRITPLDVRKQEFKKAVRGFDCDEVRAFLATLADEYEAVLVDNKWVRERLLEQEEKLAEYLKMERNLRDTLMTAERVTQETKENASRQGELIVKDAQLKARGILEECRLRTEELRREIIALRKEKESYLTRFRSLAEAQIQFVDTHRSDFDDVDRRLLDLVDTVVADNEVAEADDFPAQAEKKSFTSPKLTAASSAAPASRAFVTPPNANAEDVWRNYNAGGSGAATQATAPVASVAAAPSGRSPDAPPTGNSTVADAGAPAGEAPAENEINHVISDSLTDGAETSPHAGADAPTEMEVDLATRGIPVPAHSDEQISKEIEDVVTALTGN